MEDFVACPSRWRIGRLILGAVIFVLLGSWMAGLFGSPPTSHRYQQALVSAIGWSSIIFFGLCALVSARRLWDTGEELRIGRSGIRWTRWSDQTIPWSAISDITVWSGRGQSFIILFLHNPMQFPGKGLLGKMAASNRALTGGDVSLSLTGTTRCFDEAMNAIEQFYPRPRD